MTRLIDMTGQRFGRLSVIERSGSTGDGKARWLCRCDCGAETSVVGKDVRAGHTTSCGCLHREVARDLSIGHTRNLKHGHSQRRTPTYRSWSHMIQRTTNPNHERWADWGGRGIKVCDRWRSFENFLADMGERPDGTTIDRIDNDGDYEPGNCRWATPSEQQRNQRRSFVGR